MPTGTVQDHAELHAETGLSFVGTSAETT